MFLQCGSYSKQIRTKQISSKFVNKIPVSFQNNDDFAFSDFFIRKNPDHLQPHPENLQLDSENKQKSNSPRNDENDQSNEKKSKETIFSLPSRKVFQINYLKYRNRDGAPLNSFLRKQSSYKFKDKKELIQQRKHKSNLSSTSRTSNRYFNENSVEQKNYLSLASNSQTNQKKLLESSLIFTQFPNQANQQKAQMRQDRLVSFNLVNAYKIKSLVLGRNPKEEIYEKSKKFINNLFQKRNSLKKINERAQSENPFERNSAFYIETSRMSTEYKNQNNKSLRLPSPMKQTFRKSAKLNSIFQNIQGDYRQEQIGLEPWTKDNEIEILNDSIQEIEVDFHENKVSLDLEQSYVINLPGNRSSRNCFRKINSNKESGKMKGTILSQK